MSIDLNWETLTSGPDGDALAERIRCFIHDKFQTVPLPRFIRSVNVYGFHFGNVPPELELKDMTDPLPDFYDQELEDDESDEDLSSEDEAAAERASRSRAGADTGAAAQTHDGDDKKRRRPSGIRTALRHDLSSSHHYHHLHDLGSPFLGTSTPGFLGGPGLNYFQTHLGTGTNTPLAAVAGAHLGNNNPWMAAAAAAATTTTPPPGGHATAAAAAGSSSSSSTHHRHRSTSSISVDNFEGMAAAAAAAAAAAGLHPQSQVLREKSSVSTLAPTNVSASRPPTRDTHVAESAIVEEDEHQFGLADGGATHQQQQHRREPRVEDVQAVFRIRYAGDVRLSLTAEILLDYPMPSFVGIPLKLNVTGLSFDGVGVLAKIRKRVHFCFLSPEDAVAAVGAAQDSEETDPDGAEEGKNTKKKKGNETKGAKGDEGPSTSGGGQHTTGSFGGLLQEIKVESEIGEQDGGKQSLKNVGKVERFVLEQVRRIFDEEFVYPSFWTFLV